MKSKKNLLNIHALAAMFVLFCGNIVFAQIKFEHSTFAEIKAKAKAQHKLIFMDAYTSWCGPCKWMAANIFTNDTVARYYNATYVNAKIDMEVGEGKDIAKQYNINVYPSLLFIDENGELLHRAAGSRKAIDFIDLGKDAQIPEKQFATVEKKYKNGQRDAQFMITYLNQLANVALPIEEPLTEYLRTQKEQDLSNRTNWNIIYNFLNDAHSKEFAYLLNNSDVFTSKYTADSVNDKIFEVYSNACNRSIYSRKADSADYLPLKEEIKKMNFARKEELLLSTDMNYYQRKKDYENFAKVAAPYIDKYKSNDEGMLNNIAYEFYMNVKDKTMLAKAEQWAKKCYELNPHPEFSMDSYACLLSVNDKKQEAVKLEKQAIELIKADPKKYNQEAIPDMEKKIADWSK